jgi:Uma2 family endonuclease
MTEAQYRALADEAAKGIEVVYGHVIVCESPGPVHQNVSRNLANALVYAKNRPGLPCTRVAQDVDVTLWRVPQFTFRRPDVVVYRCLPDEGAKPDARDTLLAVEITSPSTKAEDLLDKKAQYSAAGIPNYLVIVLDRDQIERVLEFHLDAAAHEYRQHAVHYDTIALDHPFKLLVPFEELMQV